MAYEVRWAEAAIEALIEAVEYITRDSPSYAAGVAAKAERAAISLQDLPNRGRRVPEYRDRTVRELPVGNFRLIYRVDERDYVVVVIAFVHTARDLARLIEP